MMLVVRLPRLGGKWSSRNRCRRSGVRATRQSGTVLSESYGLYSSSVPYAVEAMSSDSPSRATCARLGSFYGDVRSPYSPG